jgi:hypothetical protein
MTLQVMNCETERNFPDVSIIKNRFQSTVLDEKFHYISILHIENYVTKSLSYEESIGCVRQILNFFYLVVYVVFVGFLKFVISYDFFSHSK